MRRRFTTMGALLLAILASLALVLGPVRAAIGASQPQTPPDTVLSLLARGIRPRLQPSIALPAGSTTSHVNAARHSAQQPPFQTVTTADGMLIVHYYYLDQAGAAGLLSIAQRDMDADEAHTGLKLVKQANVYVYNSRSDFLTYANVANPQITGAYTNTSTSEVFIPDYAGSDFVSALAHELTHVLLHQQIDVASLDYFWIYPLWLDEGLAESDVWPGGGFAQYDEATFAQARANSALLDIFHTFVWSYPTNVDTDNLSYAEARNFVLFLRNTYGQPALSTFIKHLDNADINYASAVGFGHDILTVQNQWRAQVGLAQVDHPAVPKPTEPTPAAFTLSAAPASNVTLHPFAVSGGDAQVSGALIVAGFALGALLLLLGTQELILLAVRRRRARKLAAHATDGSPTPPVVATSRAHRVRIISLMLVPALALAAGLVTAKVDPSLDWLHPFLGAGIATLIGVVLATVYLVLALRRPASWTSFVTAMVVLVLAGGAALFAGRMAVKAEGQSYFDTGAYALADARLREGGAPSAQLGRVHLAWANSDFGSGAYDDAAKHFRVALRLLPKGSDHDQANDSLKASVANWGAGLRAAQQFPEAIKVYGDNEKAGQCDKVCMTTFDTARGLTYLAWARHLIITGHSADAITQLTVMTRDVPAGPEVANAKLVLDNATSPFAGLKSAATPETVSARDLLILLVATQHANDDQGQAAAAYPVEVTGSIASTIVRVTPEHMLFLAFASDADARAFIHGLRTGTTWDGDPSLFRIIGHADAKNNFTAWLPAGYSYVPIWETIGPNGDLGYFYSSGTAYAIPPFSPPIDFGELSSS
ncbi:MAG TPA: hypothetical protein VF807_01495 [Ktedonobacterales bacterium]